MEELALLARESVLSTRRPQHAPTRGGEARGKAVTAVQGLFLWLPLLITVNILTQLSVAHHQPPRRQPTIQGSGSKSRRDSLNSYTSTLVVVGGVEMVAVIVAPNIHSKCLAAKYSSGETITPF